MWKIKKYFLKNYQRAFSDKIDENTIANIDPITIKVRPDVKPTNRQTMRPLDISMREAGEQLIRELLESKVIEECTSPTPWCSPAFFVKKASGAARLVTDFRALNKVVDRVGWPFPSSDSIRESILPESKVFFAIDALSGYFQLPIKKEDRK